MGNDWHHVVAAKDSHLSINATPPLSRIGVVIRSVGVACAAQDLGPQQTISLTVWQIETAL